MAATLRELRGRIRSAGSIKKITKAQELIATSRIAKAQARVQAARPYDREITNMLTELASASALDHPLLVARENPRRAGGAGGDVGPGAVRRLQRQRLPAVRGAVLAAALGGQGARPLRRRPESAGLLQLPQLGCHRVMDRLLRAARLRERAGDRVDVGRRLHGGYGRRRRRSRGGRRPRRRRTAHRVHRVQVDAVAVGDRPADRADGGGVQRARTPGRTRCSPSSRTPRPCSVRCCRVTSPPGSSPRCSRRRRRSRRRAGAP